MIKFFFKFTLSFVISFYILSVHINNQSVFERLNQLSSHSSFSLETLTEKGKSIYKDLIAWGSGLLNNSSPAGDSKDFLQARQQLEEKIDQVDRDDLFRIIESEK